MKNFIFEYQGHVYNVVKNKWFSIYENGKFITKVKYLKNLKPPIVKQKVKNCVYVSIKGNYKSKRKGHSYEFNMTFKIDLNKISENEVSKIIEAIIDKYDYDFITDLEIGFSKKGSVGFDGDKRFKRLHIYLGVELSFYGC